MGRITINREYCKGCHLCLIYCPKDLIKVSKLVNTKGVKPAEFKDNPECTGCSVCAIICPDCAIEVFK